MRARLLQNRTAKTPAKSLLDRDAWRRHATAHRPVAVSAVVTVNKSTPARHPLSKRNPRTEPSGFEPRASDCAGALAEFNDDDCDTDYPHNGFASFDAPQDDPGSGIVITDNERWIDVSALVASEGSDFAGLLEAVRQLEDLLADGSGPAGLRIEGRATPYLVGQRTPGAPSIVIRASNFVIEGVTTVDGPAVLLADEGELSPLQMDPYYSSEFVGPLLKLEGCSNFQIRDLTFDGNRATREQQRPGSLPPSGHNPWDTGQGSGGGNLIVLENCTSFSFHGVTARNSVGQGIVVGAALPSDCSTYSSFGVFRSCSVLDCEYNGLNLLNALFMRVYGGEYSRTGLGAGSSTVDREFETMAGITMEPSEGTAGSGPGFWDVVVEGAELRNNWKGLQIAGRDGSSIGAGLVTVVHCIVEGRPQTTCCEPGDEPPTGTNPCCMPGVAAWSYGIISTARRVTISNNQFVGFSNSEWAVPAVVRVAGTGAYCTRIVDNKFRGLRRTRTWARGGITYSMPPIRVEIDAGSATTRPNRGIVIEGNRFRAHLPAMRGRKRCLVEADPSLVAVGTNILVGPALPWDPVRNVCVP